ncbi:MAG: ribosomal protein L13e [Candidatus Odinarchaeum yellowstonii]|uniref:Large ribosomal subunit protein eL13 n=1 Tax=Odinarchaeota yellowstonii (strain LCB_4) TaxID=1841599 RepID=A0AAF0D2W8_ODILC|nr:MAG: ribosomal protein L13e [Candidatus Odinarchaeum yellowstonii]
MELPKSLVKCPFTPHIIRAGRGFSLGEIKESGVEINLLKKLGVYVDRRRRSVHKENINALKNILKIMEKTETSRKIKEDKTLKTGVKKKAVKKTGKTVEENAS